jgi:hypothetical protein
MLIYELSDISGFLFLIKLFKVKCVSGVLIKRNNISYLYPFIQ